jgi:two-component system, chemotaxis family, CheB/CheR fusion protein
MEDPRGCGYGTTCSDCTLLEAMQDTLGTGNGHQNIEYTTTIVNGSVSREVYMLGSTALIQSPGEPRLLLCLNDVTDRKKAELKVEALLREKALLLKESHHRIKNNMGMVKSLLNLQALQETEGACRNALDAAAGRVHSMMVLYDKLYQAEHQHELSISSLLEPLVGEILAMFDHAHPVSTEIKINDFAVRAPLLSPLAIIVNELLTNSMKYAFKDVSEPRISLSVSKAGTTVSMVYKDNGPGLPAPSGSARQPGFGMQLIELLVEQINGEIDIGRNGEAAYTIRFEA